MSLVHRFWPVILALVSFFGFEIVRGAPRAVFFVLPALWLISWLAVFLIMGPHLKTPSSRWRFWLVLAIFYFCFFGLFFLLDQVWLRRVFALLAGLLAGLFLESLHTYIWEHDYYETYSLENVAGYLNLLSAFSLSAALLGFIVFLQLPNWAFLPAVFLLYGLLTSETLWLSKIKWANSRWFVLAVAVIITELFFLLTFLPLHFLIGGAALGVLWYTCLSAARAFLLGFYSRRFAKRYLLMACFFLALLLLTTKWI